MVVSSPKLDARLREQEAKALEGSHKLRRVVGSDHAATARKPQRLQHAGERQFARQPGRLEVQVHAAKPGPGQACRCQPLTRGEFAAADLGGRDRIPRYMEGLGHPRSENGGPIAQRDDTLKRSRSGGLEDGLKGAFV